MNMNKIVDLSNKVISNLSTAILTLNLVLKIQGSDDSNQPVEFANSKKHTIYVNYCLKVL